VANGGKSSFPAEALAPVFLVATIILIFFFASLRSCYYYKPPHKDPKKYTSQKYYTILVDSFGSEAKARQRAEELRAQRINNFILYEWGKWLVCVGKFWSEDAAYNTLKALENQGISGEILYPKLP
jgi:hypothetical protein